MSVAAFTLAGRVYVAGLPDSAAREPGPSRARYP